MIKLDILRKFKIKSKSLVLNWKKYPNNKFKGMSICKTLDNLTNNSLLIMNLTVYFKTDKLSQEQYHQLKKFQVKRKVENKLKLMDSFVQKINKLTKNLMKKDNMKEIEKI